MELSRIDIVLLTVVAWKPSYAYEIEQFIKCTFMRRWVRIGSASVYVGLDRLAKKGFVTTKEEREGKMPVRYRYSVTDEGRYALEQATAELLSVDEDIFLDLNLGIFASRFLPQERIPELLAERAEKVGTRIREIAGYRAQAARKEEPSWREEAVLSTIVHFAKAEQKLLTQMIAQLNERQR